MAQKRFGPTRGAGVAIIEVEGQKTIQPGALGMVGYTGILEKGPVGELISVFSKQEFFKVCGGLIPDSLLPDAAEDYFDNAAGAGGMHLVRVTDGNEVQSELTLYSRIAATRTAMGTVKAANGGRWGGKRDVETESLDQTEYTALTITTTKNFALDQWKDAIVTIDELPNRTFVVVGNTAGPNSIITVAAGNDILAELVVAAADPARYNLELDNLLSDGETKALSILIEDGEENPDTEFALSVFVDDVLVKKYPNLATDPADGRYWVALINDDTNNDEIFVVDLVTGTHTAATRPANHYGEAASVAATVLTAEIHDVTFNVTDVLPVVTLGTTNDVMLEQVITITFSDATTFTAVSDRFGSLGAAGATGVEFVPDNKFSPPFTIAAEATLALNDTIVIQYKPFIPSSLVDGFLFPDKSTAANKLARFRITANDHVTITVALGSNMTDLPGAPAATDFLVEAAQELAKGQDGITDVDADFITQGYDVETSPFNRLFGKNFGLIKLATPGITTVAVAKAGVAYAASRNYQYRHEIPAGIVTETAAINHINGASGVGRSIYAVVSFPSFGDVTDPASRDGKLKQVSLTGQIHGREAAIVRDNDGYQKAQAGLEATLPALLDIPTKDKVLNEELLNPVGIGVIKKVKGNFIIWGDRTLFDDPEWKFKHQRELMSFYENVLREEFDFIIFAINDPANDAVAISALNGFFRPEFVKRALRGATFQEAAIIKIDSENNPDSSRANGDLIADISLKLADTVERFIIRIGKQGIFDQVG